MDVKYEPEFEELQAEIDKLSNPAATESADWKKVSQLSSAILAEKSKDILVAGYFAVSQIYLNQITGLAVGLTVYHDLIETFWEDLYPPKKRLKGRINAVTWWIEKTENALSRIKASPVAQETKKEIHDHLNGIEKFLNGQLPEPISVRPIERALDKFKTISPEKPVAEKPDASKIESATRSAPADQTAPVDIASSGDAQKVLSSGFRAIGRAALFYLKTEPTNPLGYQYMRMAAWGPVEALPVTSDGTKTIIPPPDLQFSNTLKDLMAKADYKNLLEVAEERVSDYIFWLDLHHYIVRALTGLGAPFEKARDAVCQETAFFLHLFPELLTFLFADNTPFANTETKAWARTIGFGSMPESESGLPVSQTDSDNTIMNLMAREMALATDLAKKKKLNEAVELLQQNLRKCYSKREALVWRTALSQLLMQFKKVNVAIPHLEQILWDIEKYQLEQWDPDLALNGLKTALSGFKMHPDQSAKERSEEILRRIARLDAISALNLGN
ncbi:MAG: type VI secretion system protein TssA [Proteobacteria bacterium]|nr:type VI secretion system protein TssA [Pseudomonadota bacterium]